MQHIKFPSIDQFRNVIKHVRDNAKYHEQPVPSIEFEGTVKLHGCVHRDTMITLADGTTEKISDIQIGTSILSYDINTGQIQFDTVTDVMFGELRKPWLELEFDDGTMLKCTEDHPILTSTGYVNAVELTEKHVLISL